MIILSLYECFFCDGVVGEIVWIDSSVLWFFFESNLLVISVFRKRVKLNVLFCKLWVGWKFGFDVLIF